MTEAVLAVPGHGEAIPAPNTPEWLAWRRRGLGASDVPAILGLSKYKSPFQLWLEKRGESAPSAETMLTRFGHFIEPFIAHQYAVETGCALSEGETRRHRELAFLFATPDRIARPRDIAAQSHLVELKSRDFRTAADWGDAGTDLIPQDVAVQVHVQMAVWQMARCDVAVLIGRDDFRRYTIERTPEIEDTILSEVAAFWRLVESGQEPVLQGPGAAEYLAKKFALHTDLVAEATLDEARALDLLIELRSRRDLLEAEVEDAEVAVKAMIGDRAGLIAPCGKVSWKATKGSTTTDWKALCASMDLPTEKIAQFTTTKPGVRRFVVTPARER